MGDSGKFTYFFIKWIKKMIKLFFIFIIIRMFANVIAKI